MSTPPSHNNAPSMPLQEYRSLSQRSEDVDHMAKATKDELDTPPRDEREHRVSFPWMTEVFSFALAIVALAAMVITLRVHEDRALPSWPLAISINSLVAVFTAIFKASLMLPVVEGISQVKWLWFSRPQPLADLEHFDMASRGPWGALKLVVNIILGRGKYYLASFGAAIVVATLAIDPFSQEIIQYYTCLQAISGLDARIPVAFNYSIMGGHIGPADNTLDGDMQVAIYTGIMSPPMNSSASITVDCQSGNCTFPSENGATFSSIAICHSATDTSSLVQPDPNNNNETTIYTLSESGLSVSRTTPYNSPSLGVGYTLMSTVSTEALSSTLFEFDVLMLDATCNSNDSVNGCFYQPVAAHISMWACWQTYGANITGGVYEENVLSSTPLVMSRVPTAGFALALNKTLRGGVWDDCEPSTFKIGNNTVAIDSTDGSLAPTGAGVEFGPGVLYYPEDCVSAFSFYSSISIIGFLNSLYGVTGRPVNLSAPFSDPNPQVTLGSAGNGIILQNMYRNGTGNIDTIRTYMDGLTSTMTARLRSAADGPDALKYVVGTQWGPQTCIRVRWTWISFLGGVLVLAVLFSMAVVMEGRMRRWRGDWKSSALALLFHGLNRQDAMRAGPVPLRDDMYNASREMRVQMREGNGGWRLFEDRR